MSLMQPSILIFAMFFVNDGTIKYFYICAF